MAELLHVIERPSLETEENPLCLLPEGGSESWFRLLHNDFKELLRPVKLPPLEVTSHPVAVKSIWDAYQPQKKCWAFSLGFQSAVVLLLFTVFSARTVRLAVERIMPLVAPEISPYEPKMTIKHDNKGGGGGGGDRSPLPAPKGRLPKAALKQFTPPMVIVNNPNPKLTMDPSLIIPPDVPLPQVNLPNYGDPLAKIGPLSNGPGSGGGIGSGSGGGVGSGKGPGLGPGEGGGMGGGFGGGVFRVGGGVSAPVLLYKVEPEYSEEARKAKYQGTVVLSIVVDQQGHPRNLKVVRSLGLGLDEKAIEAVEKWKFRPGYKDGKPVPVLATIEVNFRLL